MRLYIQENRNLIKFDLPANIDGSILFSFKSISGLEISVNIDAIDNNWVFKSNDLLAAVSGNSIVNDIVLKDYMCVPLAVLEINTYLLMFCLPSVEAIDTSYPTGNLQSITIGKDDSNNIVYKQNMMADRHALISLENNNWFIQPVEKNSNNYFVYLNNQVVLYKTQLYAGDIIFMNGLRIIWMQKSFIIPMNTAIYRVNGIHPIQLDNSSDNTKFTPTSEMENYITLYNENDFFSHIPRLKSVLEEDEVSVEPPPGRMDVDNDLPFILSLASSFTMMGMTSLQVFNLYNGISSGRKTIIETLPQILMVITMIVGSVLMPFITKQYHKYARKKKEKERQLKYGAYLDEKEKVIISKYKKQLQIVSENNYDISFCLAILQKRTRNLWNRVIRDDDFLEIRLGVGDRKSKLRVSAPQERFSLEDDNLYERVCNLGQKYDKLVSVPITVNLKEQVLTALILQSTYPNDFINGVLIQLLALHSPLDLKIVVFSDTVNKYRWESLKYTNHMWSDDRVTRFFSTNPEEAKILSQYLDNEFIDRRERSGQRKKDLMATSKEQLSEYKLFDSYYLIITDCYKAVSKFKFFENLLGDQYNYGFSLLVIDKDMKNIPNECKKFIVINDSESGMFSDKVSDDSTSKFNVEILHGLNMRNIARIVSNIPIQGRDAESQLPSVLSFLQMYNVGKIEQLNIKNRWLSSDPMSSLATPIGVHASGEIFNLDLHEKYDGPHGLIAGSTGSGKSEFIITFILSMALNYDPREVQFVLIDYKGGGLAGAFENREMGISIPHLVGTITNLDTAEMNRTLVSISSELQRRQRQFNLVKEKIGESTMDIYKYQRLYRDGLIDEPISHLFIISDEFAELKAQQPEFMAQLVSTARIGRSLGVHLILATQKPSGVVNDQIWSNSKFKVCLKVATKADSMEMLKRPEAASIKETGRFYLQIGYDEYFDIGQSAWSGEKYVPTERIVKKADNSINFVNNLGSVIKRALPVPKVDVKQEDLGDQLTNIVKYLHKLGVDEKYAFKKLWLPALDKTIKLHDLLSKYSSFVDKDKALYEAVIGEYDAPAIQEQGLLKIDFLNKGNLLIYGSSGSGKENIITTIVYYLSNTYSPEDVSFYIGDFGAETLKILSKIPHVADVFVTEEAQKLENFIKMISTELDRRKKEYADYGGNFIEYNKLSSNNDRFIIVVLNNFENFVESYSRISDVFSNLFRDGVKYGIVFIVTTIQSNTIRMKTAQNFLNKMVLKMPNSNDYRDLLGTPRGLFPVDNYGRGIVSIDNKYAYEFQTAEICSREERTKFIIDYAKQLVEKYPEFRAKKIPILPDVAYVDDYVDDLTGLDSVPIGVEKNSLETYVYNFVENRINLVAAKSIKNHIYFIYALIKQMASLQNVKVHVIDALSIYRGNYDNVDVCTDNLEKEFVTMYNNVSNDSKLKEEHIYFIIGISEFKKKVEKYRNNFEMLFSQVSKCKHNTFIYFDDSDNYKTIQVDDWFRDNINNTYGIWLGEDVGVQVSLGVMTLTPQDNQIMFSCIGYPIYQGHHMIVKYVVDGVDKK